MLDCFLRGLPHTYRSVEAERGTAVRVEVAGECAGEWQIRKASTGWMLETPRGDWNARVTIPQEIAWRVFTKGIGRSDALEQVRIEGDRDLGLRALGLTAIVG